MKWQDVVDISPEQFRSMSEKELRAATQILASAANKRLKRAQEQNFESWTITSTLKKGKFSTKNKSFNQLRNEFMRAKRFMQSKTGTLAEYNKFKRETIAELAKPEKGGIVISPDQFDVFWRSYEQLKEGKSKVTTKKLKYMVLTEINELQKDQENLDVDDIVSTLQKEVDEMYEKEEALTRQAEAQAAELKFWEDLPEAKPRKQEKRKNEKRKDRSAQKAARSKSRRKRR